MRTLIAWLVIGSVVATATVGEVAAGPVPAAVAFATPADAAVGPTAAGPAAAQPAAPRGDFGWPLAGTPVVLRPFDAPDHPYGPGHRGVDLAGQVGEQVLAAGAGVVAFAGMVAGRPVISVDHPNGLRTTYEPATATVTAGQRVDRGEPIGTLEAGHADCLAPACLHWGVRRGAEYLDPLWLLSPGPVRLLPAQ